LNDRLVHYRGRGSAALEHGQKLSSFQGFALK
jgi:hypothetical protein